ncbi:T9SS type A sorting domain-containing protein [Pontibacter sp. CAU 1760]
MKTKLYYALTKLRLRPLFTVVLLASVLLRANAQHPENIFPAPLSSAQQTGIMVSEVITTTNKTYALTSLEIGAKVFTDRTYGVTAVPSSLEGATLLQTANDDKQNKDAKMLSFVLSQKATVVVAYDPRAKKLPGWLTGFQKLSENIGVNDSRISSMDLYSKEFPAGKVSLGGNLYGPATGALNNYFVMVTEKIVPVLVKDIETTTGKTYILSHLSEGVTHYSDRAYKVNAVPEYLVGAPFIKTPNVDKASTATIALSFELGEKATMYVAYDPRATALPSWLEGWQKMPEKLGVDDYSISELDLYMKAFPAGKVSLGGNLMAPATGAMSNYVVVIKPEKPLDSVKEKIRSLVIYPNPNAGTSLSVMLKKYGSEEQVNITLFDLLGNKLYTTDVLTDAGGDATVELNFNRHVESGLYILRASSKSASLQRKLVVN